MRGALLLRTVFLAGAAVAIAAANASAESWPLELKRVPVDPRTRSATAEDSMFFSTSAQSFFRQIVAGGRVAPEQPDAAEFPQVIKKEPEKYESKQPFRGVARLG